MKARIVVVGSINTDLTIVAERLPGPGETVLGGEVLRAGGGKGANQAVAAARAGAQVAFVGCVGDDEFGRAAIEGLQRENINTDCTRVDERAASGVALITVDSNGENLITVAPGANARLVPSDVREARALMADADVILLQLEIPPDTVRAAAAAAREAGVRVLLNPAPAPPDASLSDLPDGLDYLTPNVGEGSRLSGMRPDRGPEEIARALADEGVGAVFLTLGAEGVCVCDGGECFRVAAPEVESVDTVGAGDCFSGTLAVALAEGMTLRDAARFAACAAALSVQKAGAQPSLPRREEIEQFCNAIRGN
ncbi:MAG: ribokinase [Planctomycetota bacterium]